MHDAWLLEMGFHDGGVQGSRRGWEEENEWNSAEVLIKDKMNLSEASPLITQITYVYVI